MINVPMYLNFLTILPNFLENFIIYKDLGKSRKPQIFIKQIN